MWITISALGFAILRLLHIDTRGKLSVLIILICMCVFVYVCSNRTRAVRRSVLAWWQWSSPLPNPEEPDSCPKVVNWTTRNVVDPRKPHLPLRRKTRRTRALWICCMPRPFLRHPLRVRGYETKQFCLFWMNQSILNSHFLQKEIISFYIITVFLA